MRSTAVAARVGLVLGVCFAICFVTGLVSHYAQDVAQPLGFPTSPAWGYRVTQGLHVITGTACVPLLLVKLWTVYPQLFRRPPRGLRRLAVEVAERLSIAVLVASAIFQLASGLANVTGWYPWAFSFRPTHYALAWVAIGSLVVHVAVKLPLIRSALGADVDEGLEQEGPPGALSRRGLLGATWAAAAVAVVATAGNTVPWLRKVSVLATHTGDGPQGLPITRSAKAAGIEPEAVGAAYVLEVVRGERTVTLSREDLLAMEQQTRTLPIACVEGWSGTADWTGVRLRDLIDLVEAPLGSDVQVTSLQQRGAFSRSVLQGGFVDDERTTLALAINGETLNLDHGYPARIIAPNRPGVLQTKWVTRLEVQA
ncbi:molybdopterin-dependent oxidoreductase [Nocardioides sp. YIM 123512]|uniref:Molybdopterin-dependent oxidoreductase n=1 Tax=Nocardioides flavescens TaxID=2691959 RepID=A0A6L7F3G5_9ACTN|nr:molybdopterin-dependent oxidoreductase [Nocardioides flavescens]MXG91766.1 molybdopterin-dependent oxidoreductase [Nocardioides flavescens]